MGQTILMTLKNRHNRKIIFFQANINLDSIKCFGKWDRRKEFILLRRLLEKGRASPATAASYNNDDTNLDDSGKSGKSDLNVKIKTKKIDFFDDKLMKEAK